MQRLLEEKTHSLLQFIRQPEASGDCRVQVLQACIQLLKSFEGAGTLEDEDAGPASHNLLVVKAGLELLVRWGITPNLSPGVGIPLQKRSLAKAAATLAAAVMKHLEVGGELGGVEEFFSEAFLQGLAGNRDLLLKSADELFLFAESGSAVGQIVVSHHVVELFAAYLQLAYGWNPEEQPDRDCTARLDQMVNILPVAHAVESLMILLAEREPSPPGWLNLQAGRLLSRLVLREGGVAAVLERLVGEAKPGSIAVFKKAAKHLARCPESVTTRQEYYTSVCSQLHRLFLLCPPPSPTKSETAVRTVTNMQQTSVLLACIMYKQDPQLGEEHLLLPLAQNLLMFAERDGMPVSEQTLLNTFWQMHQLTMAGYEGSKVLKQSLFRLLKPVSPMLLSLHRMLKRAPGAEGTSKPVFAKGFLDQKKVQDSLSPDEHQNQVDRLWGVLDDMVLALLAQPLRPTLRVVSEYLLNPSFNDVTWTFSDTEIAGRLELARTESQDAASHLVKLLEVSRNWKLTVALLEQLLVKILQFRRKAVSEVEVDRVEHAFEVVVSDIGTKAMEESTVDTLSVVRNLLGDDEFWKDEDVIQLVLQMLGTSLKSVEKSIQEADQPHILDYSGQLREISDLLEKMTGTEGVTPTVKDMGQSLSGTIQRLGKI